MIVLKTVTSRKHHVFGETSSLHPLEKEDVNFLAEEEPDAPVMMEEESLYDDIIGAFPSVCGGALEGVLNPIASSEMDNVVR